MLGQERPGARDDCDVEPEEKASQRGSTSKKQQVSEVDLASRACDQIFAAHLLVGFTREFNNLNRVIRSKCECPTTREVNRVHRTQIAARND